MTNDFLNLYHLRKKLIPYLVREGLAAIESGRPLMAGLFFDYPSDHEIWKAPFQFMCGRSILVAPVTDPEVRSARVYLPDGVWECFWSGEIYEGGKWIEVDSPSNQTPAFIKEGSSIF